MVDGGHRLGGIADSRRMHSRRVTEERAAPRLVEGRPPAHLVVQRLEDGTRVVRKANGGVAYRPASGVLERLRQVPVIERRHRIDAGRSEGIDEPPIEVEPTLFDRAASVGHYPRPSDRKAVHLDPEPRHERDVLAKARVMVGGDVARVAATDRPRTSHERVPDRRPSPVSACCSFDLVRRRRDAPCETGWEHERRARPHAITRRTGTPAAT